MSVARVIQAIKMVFNIFYYLSTMFFFLINFVWFCCTFVCALVPWVMLLIAVIFVLSKFIKLKTTYNKSVLALFGDTAAEGSSANLYWPVANRGAAFDSPENSASALKQCTARNCKLVLFDLAITKCGELVILHKSTIEKAKINDPISQITFESLQNFNISEYHALSGQFPPEKILTLANLLTLMENMDISVFLLLSSSTAKCVDALKHAINSNVSFSKRIVICSNSVYAIYQLRKACPDLVCGLWMDKVQTLKRSFLRTTALYMSIYGAMFRNILVPVIGISVVFINKDEYNAHTKNLWTSAGVCPIVYSVNSPNEKRYFQKVLKTQYLTNSLRSEPHFLVKTKDV